MKGRHLNGFCVNFIFYTKSVFTRDPSFLFFTRNPFLHEIRRNRWFWTTQSWRLDFFLHDNFRQSFLKSIKLRRLLFFFDMSRLLVHVTRAHLIRETGKLSLRFIRCRQSGDLKKFYFMYTKSHTLRPIFDKVGISRSWSFQKRWNKIDSTLCLGVEWELLHWTYFSFERFM